MLSLMTIDEKIGQLNLPGAGDINTGQASNSNIAGSIRKGNVGGLFNIKTAKKIREVQRIAVEESRLKIPLIFGMDVIHGYKTVFPIPLALSCTWNPEMIELSARVAAKEASADGICWTFSPMVDIARDPRWGRIAEGGGEDPFLGSEIARAMVRGYQGNNLADNNTIMACVKHMALYGASEAGRDYNTTDMSRIRMYNEYLAPYRAALEEGAGSIMTSFNEIDGIPASANKWLLTELLRNQWKFNGFVVTDYTAINEMSNHGLGDLKTVSALALHAGVDMDMVGEGFLTTLKQSLQNGAITEKQIDIACARILEAKFKLGLFDDPYKYCDLERAKTEIFTEENKKIAREIAAESFVLLKNEGRTLPLKKRGVIALVGPMADNRENMSGTWSVAADVKQAISLREGIEAAVGDKAQILYARGANIYGDSILESRVSIFGKPTYRDSRPETDMIREAVRIAHKADVIVAAVGESAEMTGESSSRTDIGIPGVQRDLLKALKETGKPVVLVLFTGRPLTLAWEENNFPAILNVWFAGSEAGHAIADVLFGDVNPSGKITATFPRNVGQVPIYYSHKNTGRPLPPGVEHQKFTSNYLDVSNEPLYPFGYGLGYSAFDYSNLKLSDSVLYVGKSIQVSVDVENTGNYDGKEVVQLYTRDMVGSITRPVKELKGFKKIALKKGERTTVLFSLAPEDLAFYSYDLTYGYEPGKFEVYAGGNSRDVLSASFVLKTDTGG
ncbi:MAG: beta-glucosidase BglX [Cytophagales bacterium]|nr:beta-glucosidase BglX [Cytophagales bacterium]